ncbi:TPA: hypothetical protein L4S95_006193 [Pseudomonas aeruginosa]|uniref:hypothetical protein n=1 Tax=Pseudomonas aeruginosa TaxID=287 RepID=UPI001484C808|nr:hypothetical protein [Pseudomonas aeruginosa]EKX2958388.1 hypothetical protein [Pseudomonas aeruginosa]MBB4847440.1 hypothetical protein [Pseudomonas aeruginosa]MBG4113000.1 hypothetical protein [Pseudomonas aeruginosa]MBG6817249.1 hypothetical protein [Pseudomonas aeruginosa]
MGQLLVEWAFNDRFRPEADSKQYDLGAGVEALRSHVERLRHQALAAGFSWKLTPMRLKSVHRGDGRCQVDQILFYKHRRCCCVGLVGYMCLADPRDFLTNNDSAAENPATSAVRDY